MKVHDCDNVNAVRLDAIQKAVWKLRNEDTPQPTADWRSAGGELGQSFVSPLDREDEVESEAGRLVFVELGRRNELVLGVGMKLNASHRSAERAFFMTLSAGIAATLPDFSSVSRRSASASQSRSASASTSGSRLEIS